MNVYLERSEKADKSAFLGVQSGAFCGFAALRYDARSLLRLVLLCAGFVLKQRKSRKKTAGRGSAGRLKKQRPPDGRQNIATLKFSGGNTAWKRS